MLNQKRSKTHLNFQLTFVVNTYNDVFSISNAIDAVFNTFLCTYDTIAI